MNIRNIFVMLLLMVVIIPANHVWADGPIDKGSYMIGGMLGVAFLGGELYDDQGDTHQIRIELDWQRFFIPKLALGFGGIFEHSQAGDDRKTMRCVGPVVTYYLDLGEADTYPFIEAAFMYALTDFDNVWGDDEVTSITYEGSIGIAQFVVKNVAIVGKLGYRHTTLDYAQDEDLKENEFGVSFGLRAFIY